MENLNKVYINQHSEETLSAKDVKTIWQRIKDIRNSDLQGTINMQYGYRKYVYALAGIVNGIQNPDGKFQNLSINVNGDWYIEFADPEVEKVCTHHFGDGLGVTENAASKALNLPDAATSDSVPTFNGNKNIDSFEEFKYFTSIATIKNNTFKDSSIRKIQFPYGVTVNSYVFQNCTNLESPINVLLGNGATYAFANTAVKYMKLKGTHCKYRNYEGCNELKELTVIMNNTWPDEIQQKVMPGMKYMYYEFSTTNTAFNSRSLLSWNFFETSQNLEYLKIKINGSNALFTGEGMFRYASPKLKTFIIDSDFVVKFEASTNYVTIAQLTTKKPNVKFYVPQSLLEDYKADEQWSKLSDYIYGFDEENPYPTYELEHPWDD